jgi:hypothetical protein
MERVTLYDERNDSVSVTITAFFDSKGAFVVDGYDRGPFVEERTGDWDCEYSVTVASEHVHLLYSLFNLQSPDRLELLEAVRKRFEGPLVFSSFKALLRDSDIAFSSFHF